MEGVEAELDSASTGDLLLPRLKILDAALG
jgi:hypothetical protein